MAPEPEVAAPVPDLLGRILSSQSLLMLSSADVLIHRDGSLSAKRPGTCCLCPGVLWQAESAGTCTDSAHIHIYTFAPHVHNPHVHPTHVHTLHTYILHLSNTSLYINIHTRVHASHALHCTYTLAPRAHKCLTPPCMQQD